MSPECDPARAREAAAWDLLARVIVEGEAAYIHLPEHELRQLGYLAALVNPRFNQNPSIRGDISHTAWCSVGQL